MKLILIFLLVFSSRINSQDNPYADISNNLYELSEELGDYAEVLGYPNDAQQFIISARDKYGDVMDIIRGINILYFVKPNIKDSKQDWFKSFKLDYYNFWISQLKLIKQSLISTKDMLESKPMKKNIDQGIKNIDLTISELTREK